MDDPSAGVTAASADESNIGSRRTLLQIAAAWPFVVFMVTFVVDLNVRHLEEGLLVMFSSMSAYAIGLVLAVVAVIKSPRAPTWLRVGVFCLNFVFAFLGVVLEIGLVEVVKPLFR